MKKELLDKIAKAVDAEEFYASLIGWKGGKANASCPFPEKHKNGEDKLPSMKVFVETGGTNCHGCGYKCTSAVYFLADYKRIPLEDAARELYSEWVEKLVPEEAYRGAHENLLENKFILGKIKELRGLTLETVKRFLLGYSKSRLTIPIFNEFGLCVNIRRYDLFKQSDVKMLPYAEGFGSARLYPLEILKSQTVYIVEGELDALIGIQNGLACMSPTIGNTVWEEKWNKFFKDKMIIIIPDNDDPGKAGAIKRRNALQKVAKSCRILELPRLEEEGEDLTDWLMKYEGSEEELSELAGQKAEERKETRRHSDAADLPIEATARSTSEEALVQRAEAVWQTLESRGNFFRNQEGELYYAHERDGVMRVMKEPGQFIHLLTRINPIFNQATSVGKFVLEHIKNEAVMVSALSRSGAWTMYHGGSLYVHAGKDKILKVSDKEVAHLRNAINDEKVLLNIPVPGMEVTGLPERASMDGLKALRTYFMDNLAMPEEDRYLFICWMMGIFFRDYIKPKPLMRLLARTAFGKSTASKMMSLLIYGQEMLNSSASTMAAYYEMSATHPMVIIDNLETQNMVASLEDFLLSAATGGVKSKRVIASDTGMIQHRINCLVLTNGIEPFRKHELIDRTIELGMDIGKYGNAAFHETKVFSGLLENRQKIVTAILYLIHKYVLPRVQRGEPGRIMGEFGAHGKERFNEYFALMAIMLDALWGYMPAPGFKSSRELTARWLQSQTSAVKRQTEGTDEVLYFLETYADRYNQLVLAGAQVPVAKSAGGGVEIKFATRELLSDFRLLARTLAMRCPWSNDRQLGARLVDSSEVLARAGWRSLTFIRSGKKMHKYWKEADDDGKAIQTVKKRS